MLVLFTQETIDNIDRDDDGLISVKDYIGMFELEDQKKIKVKQIRNITVL